MSPAPGGIHITGIVPERLLIRTQRLLVAVPTLGALHAGVRAALERVLVYGGSTPPKCSGYEPGRSAITSGGILSLCRPPHLSSPHLVYACPVTLHMIRLEGPGVHHLVPQIQPAYQRLYAPPEAILLCSYATGSIKNS